ncbi:hypothetical protein Bca4012_086832 [Brassica carinata]
MEESSERVVRLEQHDEITMGDDLVIHSIPQDLALAVSAIYDRMMASSVSPTKNVNDHGQLFVRLDEDAILRLEYLDDPRRCLHRFIYAIGFCHSHVKTLLLDANVDLLIIYMI